MRRARAAQAIRRQPKTSLNVEEAPVAGCGSACASMGGVAW